MNDKIKVNEVTLINPKPVEEKELSIIADVENLRRASRDIIFDHIAEKFDLPRDVLKIREHPSMPLFRIHEGLLSIAAYLEKKGGYTVRYLQQDFLEKEKLWKGEFKKACNSSVVGLTCCTPTYKRAVRLARAIKRINPNSIVVIGGPHVSVMDVQAIRDGADIVVRGEGEVTMFEVLTALEKGWNKLREINGITFNLNGRIKKNPDSKPPDLNLLPSPSYHLVPEQLRNITEVLIWTSRGCPYCCKFCVEWKLFKPLRFRSPENVLSDLIQIKQYFNSKHVFITDSEFPLNRKNFEQLRTLLRKQGLDLYFSCFLRANMATKTLIEELADMNVIQIYIGMESGSDVILKKMNKGETWSDYVNCLKITRGKIPFIVTSWMTGFPGETYRTLYETVVKLDWLHRKELITDSFPRVFIPYPGTPMFHSPEQYGMKILTYDYEKYSRKAFPAVHRLKNLNEYEIALASLQLFLIGTKHLVRQAQMKDAKVLKINI